MNTFNKQKFLCRLNFPHTREVLLNQSGSAIIFVLLFLILLAALVPVAMQNTSKDIERTTGFAESRQAFYNAEAGIEQAKALAREMNFNEIIGGTDGLTSTAGDNGLFIVAGSSTFNHDGNLFTQVNFGQGSYNIRFYDNNDGDGNLLADSDDLAYIHSIGISDRLVTKEIIAMVKKANINPPNFPAAVTLVGDTATIDNQGSGFEVDGRGYDASGNPDPNCGDVNGMATESSLVDTTINFAGNAENHIHGASGLTPDIVHDQNQFTLEDAQNLYNELTPVATILTPQQYSGGTFGTDANPQVTYFKPPPGHDGDVRFTGNITGVGVLIIDGDLDMSATLNFKGIIMVGVCVTCTGRLVGTGSSTILGAMVIGNPVTFDDTPGSDATVNFTGNSEIMYSCEALNQAAGSLKDTFRTVSWREVN